MKTVLKGVKKWFVGAFLSKWKYKEIERENRQLREEIGILKAKSKEIGPTDALRPDGSVVTFDKPGGPDAYPTYITKPKAGETILVPPPGGPPVDD